MMLMRIMVIAGLGLVGGTVYTFAGKVLDTHGVEDVALFAACTFVFVCIGLAAGMAAPPSTHGGKPVDR